MDITAQLEALYEDPANDTDQLREENQYLRSLLTQARCQLASHRRIVEVTDVLMVEIDRALTREWGWER